MMTAAGKQPTPENRSTTLVTILNCRAPEYLKPAITPLMEAHDNFALVGKGLSEKACAGLKQLPAEVICIDHNGGHGRAIKAAARQARGMGMTHMITLDAAQLPSPEQLAQFLQAAAANDAAILVGRRRHDASGAVDAGGRNPGGGRWKNFWFRLQTGTRLTDAASRMRSYPLGVMKQLRLHAKRDAFDMEVLTKAAWAGVQIKEVDIRLPAPPNRDLTPGRQSLGSFLEVLWMTVHLTMRSITPWPHRKIVMSGHRPQETISVLRPLKSIRALLTENITPIQLAAAASMGVFIGTLPLIALHTVVILFVCSYFRLNKVATLAASQLCTPPIVPAICIEVGYFLRHGQFLTEFSLETLGYQALERIWEWLLGSLVVAPVLAALVGGLVFVVAVLISKGMREGRQRSAHP